MFRQLTSLIGGTLLFWALLLYPAKQWWGETAIVFSATAAAICLVPAVLTLIWVHNSAGRSSEQMLLAGMGGSAVRMGVVFVAVIALSANVAYFQPPAFLTWVLVFYLFTLALEVVLLVWGQVPQPRGTARSPEASS